MNLMNPPPHSPVRVAPAVQMSELLVKGKTYRLYKRDPATGREVGKTFAGWAELPFNFRFTFRGKSYGRCLETADSDAAQKNARAKARAILAGVISGEQSRLDLTKSRQAVGGTVQDLLTAYETAPLDAEADTRTQNAHALRQLLSIALETLQPATCHLQLVNGSVARAWFTAASQKALEAADQSDKISIKRSANSRFVQAKSIFVPKALALYRELGLYQAGFEEFVKAGETFKFSKLPVSGFNPPAESVINATLEAWEKIGAAGDVPPGERNLFLAIGHELAFGLRTGELSQAAWSWWTSREGYPVLDNGSQAVTVKNNTGMIQVRALDPWFTIMSNRIKARGWNTAPGSVLVGNHTARTDATFRAVSAFLRGHGWTTGKTNHELRKFAGSQVAMRYGIYEAQCWLRHSTVNVTEQHYTGYVKRFKPADVATLAARWATLTPAEPILRIVNGTP